MRIALIAPPFVSVPPRKYGGTELFIAQLAEGLQRLGEEVVVYANGESTVDVPVRWMFEKAQWPIQSEIYDNLKDLNHTMWAVADAARTCDVIHLNNAPGLSSTRFVDLPFVCTIHHPYDGSHSDFYSYFPRVNYVTISEFQRQRENLPQVRTIHHGLDLSLYRVQQNKDDYLAFIGRIAPEKGTHLAIQVAKRSGIPLKIAGEIQPIFRDYYEQQIKPQIDGKFIEYTGEADMEAKNELLGKARAMLFPIQWDEPFGLVLIEAMACGTPVLALPGGSVCEIVVDGVSGHVCGSVDEMAQRARGLALSPQSVRSYAEKRFSLERMVTQYAAMYEEIVAGAHAHQAPANADVVAEVAAEDDSGDNDELTQDRAIA